MSAIALPSRVTQLVMTRHGVFRYLRDCGNDEGLKKPAFGCTLPEWRTWPSSMPTGKAFMYILPVYKSPLNSGSSAVRYAFVAPDWIRPTHDPMDLCGSAIAYVVQCVSADISRVAIKDRRLTCHGEWRRAQLPRVRLAGGGR